MTDTTALWTFALVVGLLTMTPGLDTALILRTAAVGHRSRAWGVVLGIQTGTLLWGVLSSLGVTAVLAASRIAYDGLRLAGATYLLWMGSRMLAATLRRRTGEDSTDSEADDLPTTDTRDHFGRGWRQGLTTNALNPKVQLGDSPLGPPYGTGRPVKASRRMRSPSALRSSILTFCSIISELQGPLFAPVTEAYSTTLSFVSSALTTGPVSQAP
ncbi:LysE family translocator [Streptomyces brasiliensis]|uniref:Uncharacterized protein n=1 Tax=Streptomyces brasiliensis TaxID=1954 RepID=A0A917P6A5_9ACTN|nr:LysE family translocator [Streptomyces brasiliensis]GGJ63867.1 hypothetical protein GCM10010121_088160 [Streptomyces brasiliensis]